MRMITIDDPRWHDTFPHTVRLRAEDDEWLPEVMLRCDHANSWPVGTTGYYVAKGRPASTGHLNNAGAYIVATGVSLGRLARSTAVDREQLERTTFLPELRRLYGMARPTASLLGTIPPFRVCPLCVGEGKMLGRQLALPNVGMCPRPGHNILLVDTCRCGVSLEPYRKGTAPFTCGDCGLEWARLPAVAAKDDIATATKRVVALYDTFFTRGTRRSVEAALRHIKGRATPAREVI